VEGRLSVIAVGITNRRDFITLKCFVNDFITQKRFVKKKIAEFRNLY
jgi:hypothetical protein